MSTDALAGVYLYPTELNLANGQVGKIQIITNAYEQDDTGYLPVNYVVNWGDGSRPTVGKFPTGKYIKRNVVVSHAYNYGGDPKYDSASYNPSVTISTENGGVRTVNNGENGNSCKIYVWKDGTDPIPSPNMDNYQYSPDF